MIGVFDSGFGGLNILKYFLRDLPGYDYVYLGDNAHAPYGEKSHEIIFTYTAQAVDFLRDRGCRLIILACNSASAQALKKIQQEYLPQVAPDVKVLGVVIPIVEKIAENDKIKRVGVLGTAATISSGVYQREIKKIRPDLEVWGQAAPLLVPLVEKGEVSGATVEQILKDYLKPLQEKRIEALILGCTHYPFLAPLIKKIMGQECLIPEPGEIISVSLKNYLFRHSELELVIKKSPSRQFYTTGNVKPFREIGEKFLGAEIENLRGVKLS